MHTTLEVWDEMVKEIRDLKLFTTVEPYPLNRLANAQFLKDLDALKAPVCLIIWRGRSDDIQLQALQRDGQWAAVIYCVDAGGDAYRAALELLDKFTDAVLDKKFMNDNVWIKGTHSVDAEPSGPRKAVYTILFKTTQLKNRVTGS